MRWQRHQLVRLSGGGWERLRDGDWDTQAQDCLGHWAHNGLPLVVTRQHAPASLGIGLGLAAPGRWGRRRFALAVPPADIAQVGAFPVVERLPPLLRPAWRSAWQARCAALAACGVQARVYGSHGWQLLTGLDHLREGSDIDLLVAVDGPAQADAVAAVLQTWPDDAPRLDGELVFADGSAVAWREWQAWRARRTPAVLVKRLDGVRLAQSPFWRQAQAA